MRDISVIIPCAGKGTRLGIPFSKELFPVSKEQTLIDCCFERLYPFKDKVSVVIIIAPDKTDLVRHLYKYCSDFEMVFLYQSPENKEFLGALESSKSQYSRVNVLMLPDIIVKDSSFSKKLTTLINETDKDGIGFGVVYEGDYGRLQKMGAIRAVNNRLEALAEKPDKNPGLFNCYWIYISWKGSMTELFLAELKSLYANRGKRISDESTLIGKPVVVFDKALDLGVWPNVISFFSDNMF